MTRLFHEAGFSFGIAHANFQLRGEESERDARFVQELAAKYGVPFLYRLSIRNNMRNKTVARFR